jgi:hypothetical protein
MVKQKRNELEIHVEFKYYMNKSLLNITIGSRKQQIISFVLWRKVKWKKYLIGRKQIFFGNLNISMSEGLLNKSMTILFSATSQ